MCLLGILGVAMAERLINVCAVDRSVGSFCYLANVADTSVAVTSQFMVPIVLLQVYIWVMIA